VTRFWPGGLPITAVADELATPTAFIWHGTTHAVEHITKRWRVDQSWWRVRVCREYFLLRTIVPQMYSLRIYISPEPDYVIPSEAAELPRIGGDYAYGADICAVALHSGNACEVPARDAMRRHQHRLSSRSHFDSKHTNI
jgi:hypothetical protein